MEPFVIGNRERRKGDPAEHAHSCRRCRRLLPRTVALAVPPRTASSPEDPAAAPQHRSLPLQMHAEELREESAQDVTGYPALPPDKCGTNLRRPGSLAVRLLPATSSNRRCIDASSTKLASVMLHTEAFLELARAKPDFRVLTWLGDKGEEVKTLTSTQVRGPQSLGSGCGRYACTIEGVHPEATGSWRQHAARTQHWERDRAIIGRHAHAPDQPPWEVEGLIELSSNSIARAALARAQALPQQDCRTGLQLLELARGLLLGRALSEPCVPRCSWRGRWRGWPTF